jgi:UDP-N-acetylmuramoyl-L-alanyl-D-glutamate--2,6-diaminopimelate ligase
MPEDKADIANIYDNQAISESPKKDRQNRAGKSGDKKVKRKLTKNRIKAKILNTYYGHPARDMKLIVVTGMTGKTAVAHFIHHIINEAGERVAVLASESEIKTGMLHKFLSDAWKAGANYVVVTAPAESIDDDLFAELDIYAAVLTDYIPSRIGDASAKEFEEDPNTLFDMAPEYVVLNRDDKHYADFEKTFKGERGTITYGEDKDSDVVIESSKLYKMGSEAHLKFDGHRFVAASFLNKQTDVSYMACASALGLILGLDEESIINGIASYDPQGITPIDAPKEETPTEEPAEEPETEDEE